jgi:GNAT superfamily N-acetyltransferase
MELEAFTIRNYQPSDLARVLELHKEAMLAVGAYKGDGPWDDDLRDIERHYIKNGGAFIIGQIGSSIIAIGAYRSIDCTTAEIKRMRTQPAFQGKGLGAVILRELIRRARQSNYKNLILETSDKQAAAMKLYKRNGFKEIRKEIIDGYSCTWYRLIL